MSSYSRYKSFVSGDGTVQTVPYIEIPKRNTDKYMYWKRGISRMDLVSYQYYQDANYGWLILQANPELSSIEYLIDDGGQIRIPYPLESVISQYENDIKIYKQVEGTD